MRSHAPFAPIDLEVCLRVMLPTIVPNFLKIGVRVSELQDPEKWPFPLKTFIALTTVGTTSPHCENAFAVLFSQRFY